ncbi:hypothetical protein BD626DRAFT_520928 [Schizophyllum amplum]|uniref:F-box domain-containing protein n=1 Tax=Schizophyllum amplum TaxID=97359 RepID=A0A550BU63_9AGAR|nr:hypothetical protein BD626DRAFT_520928 [Auriculariopsis ampla]
MHTVLTIRELLFAVFEDGVLHRADIASIALVCRLWSDVANIVLWSKLDSLIPLLRLLPDNAWSVRSLIEILCGQTSMGGIVCKNLWRGIATLAVHHSHLSTHLLRSESFGLTSTHSSRDLL